MNKHKFSKPPISDPNLEKKIDDFINLSDTKLEKPLQQSEQRIFKKESTKPLYLRAPESLWMDIHEVMALTGLSMNAICLELLRPAIKQKLKDLHS